MSRSASIVLLLFVFLLSCSKKVVPVIAPPPKTIDIQEVDFGYMLGKAHLNFKDEKKDRDLKANIRIHKDSVIWMTFSVIGVQGGKGLINNDSITIVSSVDKEYYVFEYSELSKRFNFHVDFASVQAAMLGNLILPRREGDVISEDSVYNTLTQTQGTITVKNFINRVTKKIERVEVLESMTNNSIRIDYSNFQPLGDKLFPYRGSISVLYRTNSAIINNSITFEYTKAELGDKDLKFPFNIPKKYERR